MDSDIVDLLVVLSVVAVGIVGLLIFLLQMYVKGSQLPWPLKLCSRHERRKREVVQRKLTIAREVVQRKTTVVESAPPGLDRDKVTRKISAPAPTRKHTVFVLPMPKHPSNEGSILSGTTTTTNSKVALVPPNNNQQPTSGRRISG